MKHIILAFCLLLGAQFALAQNDQYTVKVDGLGCPFCAYGLEKKFKEVESIAKIKIDLESGMLSFVLPAEKAMTVAQVEDRVELAGYTPKHVHIKRANGTEEQSSAPHEASAAGGGERKSFKVSGSCEMCKARIEAAALEVKGVQKAEWNAERQMLTVDFDSKLAPLADIQAAVAKSGHDNAGARASAKVYDNLPACCQYR